MIASSEFTELVVNLFLGMQEEYKDAAENAELDEETTMRFLQSHGMEPRLLEGKDGDKFSDRYRESIEALAFEWLRGAVDYDGQREVVRDFLLPEWLEARELDTKARALLSLPECWCDETPCPEVAINVIGHPNETAVRELYKEAGSHLPDPKAEEERALRAGQAGKAAFLAALAEGKSRTEANEIALAAAAAARAAEDEEEF
jgi:hypothetical protein